MVRATELVDVILGPVAITWPNAMMGEVTPRMAEAISSTPALKILIPLHQENMVLVGSSREPLPHLIETMINEHSKEVFRNV